MTEGMVYGEEALKLMAWCQRCGSDIGQGEGSHADWCWVCNKRRIAPKLKESVKHD